MEPESAVSCPRDPATCLHPEPDEASPNPRCLYLIINFNILVSGFCRLIDENCALVGYYKASSGNLLSSFRNSSNEGPIRCPETSVRNYHYSLCNKPEEHSSQF